MTPIQLEIEKLAEKYRVGGVLHIDDNGGMLGANFVTYSKFVAAMRELIPLVREEMMEKFTHVLADSINYALTEVKSKEWVRGAMDATKHMESKLAAIREGK